MSAKYPEIRRINARGDRELHGERHNHCFSSPVYRDKVRIINTKLAERYKGHKALAGWHISNEYSGTCYCDYCLDAFRAFLKTRYPSLDALNLAYWSAFWSQKFQTWEQIDPRDSPVDASQARLGPVHHAPDRRLHEARDRAAEGRDASLPCTTNMMSTFEGLDYWRFTDVCDRVSLGRVPHGARARLVAAGRLAVVRPRHVPRDEGRRSRGS